MPSEEGHKAVPWQLGGPASLEERLLRSLETTEREDGSEDVRWVCPRCFHEHFSNVFRDSMWAGMEGTGRSGEVELRCECGGEHPGRPADEVGCGYRTMVMAAEEEE